MSAGIVYVIDDNDDFRLSLRFMLESEGFSVEDYACPVTAIDALQAQRAGNPQPGCLVLDIRMPDMSGLDVHDRLHQCHLDVPVIYMTGHADVPLAVEAMKKGAVTLLEKPLQKEALVAALNDTLARQTASENPALNARMETLTPRETEVLECIVAGKANKVCAIELGISVRTVELHRSRLMKKLAVRSGPELIRTVLLHRQQRAQRSVATP